jgi:hypothetical protein
VRTNACHIDSLIASLYPYFIGKQPQEFLEGTLKRKICDVIHSLDASIAREVIEEE